MNKVIFKNDDEQNPCEVPVFKVIEYSQKRSRYCVIVFVLNEGKKILKQLDRMRHIAKTIDIIIADGGSTDGVLIDDNLKACNIRVLLVKTDSGKLSAQMRMAFFFGINQGYDGIITIDGNNKDNPDDIPRFIEDLDKGYDHIQGSRFITGGKGVNTPLLRLIGIKFLHAPLISIAAGFRYTDTTNGFRAYSSRFLQDPKVAPFRKIFSLYELHYYLAIRAAELGYKVKEVPVTRSYPGKGAIPTKISPFKGNICILLTLLKACVHYFDPLSLKSNQ